MSQKSTQPPDAEQWVRDYGPALHRYALSRVLDHGVAEELVQETFLAGLKSFERFQGQSSVQTWLIGILRHKLLDHFRQESKKRESEVPLDDSDPEGDLFDERGRWARPPVKWNVDPHSALHSEEFRQVLARCLRGIPPQKRTVLLLRAGEGLSGKEICKQLAITPTHLWVLMHRARGALRRCLEEHWFGIEGGKHGMG
ncbi:MAG: sigma-70 family RNA polymerase sigma factor [Acidobacteria bacterium]|nr:sigma-70 family RNA polymerase sigma factor [Acidobacteriota bacterium]